MVGLPTIGSADTCINQFLTRDPHTLETELNQLAILNGRNCEGESQCKHAISLVYDSCSSLKQNLHAISQMLQLATQSQVT